MIKSLSAQILNAQILRSCIDYLHFIIKPKNKTIHCFVFQTLTGALKKNKL